MIEPWGILLSAFALDLMLGDPVYRLHPVRLIGNLSAALTRAFFRRGRTGYVGGGLFFAAMVTTVTAAVCATHVSSGFIHPIAQAAWDIFILYSCIAVRDTAAHALPTAEALEQGDLFSAQDAVQRIVGRNARFLDAHGVARAAVESASEGLVDGALSPMFWFGVGAASACAFGQDGAMFGIAFAAFYRVTNTLDSMVGYRSERYLKFGCISARADDVLNFIPARLAILCLIPSAVLRRLGVRKATAAWRRDRLKSSSPNSAHTESFAGGALGLLLNGPAIYSFGRCDKPWIGEGTPEATAQHIRQCVHLVVGAAVFWAMAESGLLYAAARCVG